MSDKEKQINLKLTIIESVDYEFVKPFLEFAKKQGYKIIMADNGNIIFEKDRPNNTCATKGRRITPQHSGEALRGSKEAKP